MGLAHRLLKPCRLLCLAPWIEWAPRTFENDQSILLTGKRGGRGEREGREVIASNGEREEDRRPTRHRIPNSQSQSNVYTQSRNIHPPSNPRRMPRRGNQSCRIDPVGSNFAPRPFPFLPLWLKPRTRNLNERKALRA